MIADFKRKIFREYISGKLGPFFRNSDLLIFVLGSEWEIEYVNSSGYSSLNISAKEILGIDFLSILSEESRTEAEKYLTDNSVESDTKTGLTLELVCCEGNKIPVRFNVSKFHDNMFSGTIWSGEKIKSQTVSRSAVKEDERIARIIEFAPFGIVMVNSEDKILSVNKEFENLTGYRLQDIPDKESWFEKAYPDSKYREFVSREWKRYKGIENLPRIFEVTCKDSKKRKLEFRIQKFENDRLLVYLTDLTERLQKQETIRESIKELSRSKFLIEKNNIQLKELNAKLKESESKLSELNETKDKFFSILAHDLRSPFSALLSLSNLAVSDFETFDSETMKSILNDINNSAKNFFNLLENLLTWTRITSDRMDFDPVEFDLNEIIDEIVDLLKQNAIDKQINVSVELEKKYSCFADKNMVRRILQNLISNAIKFTYRKGEIRILVSEYEDSLKIQVKDSGTGIDKDDLKNLFRIDVRQSTKGTEKESGTGLGLILCKELVEKNGGKISVESIPEVGSEFSFTLKRQN